MEDTTEKVEQNRNSVYNYEAFRRVMSMPGGRDRFQVLAKQIYRDLNNTSLTITPSFNRYTKEEINTYMQNPYQYRKQLRAAAIYLYGVSPHFRRLIQYFVSLSDLAYVVSPINIDPLSTNPRSIQRNYRKVLQTMTNMHVKNQFPKIMTVCFREDVFYGTIIETTDDVAIMQLPSDYCAISSIEGGVFNVTFDFSYFSAREGLLEYYPAEFTTMYNAYKKDSQNMRWQELPSPNSFALKINDDIIEYELPPFAGIFRDIYDLEDYRNLKLTKTALENYAVLVMTLGVNENGEWQFPLEMARDFWSNLDAILPEEIGSILTPMPVEKISFERTHTGDTNNVADSEESLFTSAGVSSLLFNNPNASANALSLSIKVDQGMTYKLVKSIEMVINRYIQAQSYGKNFKVGFLDVSPFNRKEMGDQYLKALNLGLPMISHYAASQGLPQNELDSMAFLENEVLLLPQKLQPLQSAATSSSSTGEGDGEPGAPEKDIGEVSDKREKNSEAE